MLSQIDPGEVRKILEFYLVIFSLFASYMSDWSSSTKAISAKSKVILLKNDNSNQIFLISKS